MNELKKIRSGGNNPYTEDEKEIIIKNAEKAYGDFLTALQFDWENDPNMCDSPRRVSRMFVREIAKGCYDNPPKITVFDNVDHYDGMVFEGNITVKSMCSHHVLGFIGKACVAYIPDENGKICGLSKLNRVVDFFSRRPQVQENLTTQIHDYLNALIPGNKGIAVVIEAEHMCVKLRGVEHDSSMSTSKLSGLFLEKPEVRKEFYDFLRNTKK